MKKVLLILFSVVFVSCTSNNNCNKLNKIITDIGVTEALLVYKTDKTNVDSLINRLHELNMEFNQLDY